MRQHRAILHCYCLSLINLFLFVQRVNFFLLFLSIFVDNQIGSAITVWFLFYNLVFLASWKEYLETGTFSWGTSTVQLLLGLPRFTHKILYNSEAIAFLSMGIIKISCLSFPYWCWFTKFQTYRYYEAWFTESVLTL